jgi:2,4-dienoyl-CoA reductase-like NADH-dependent reductase (Old Yellow Enzyme family)
MSGLHALWEPVRIGHVQARNRIYLPAHQPSYDPVTYGAYLLERARGGVGLIVTHGFHVHATSAAAGVSPWEPAWADAVRRFAAPSQAEGVPVFVQITHMGASGRRRTDSLDLWGSVLAPSAIPSPVHRAMPKPMEEQDIRDVIAGFAATAANVQAGGADGVEITAPTAPTATCCPTFCRPGGTAGTTPGAATPNGAPDWRWRSATPCARAAAKTLWWASS